MGGTRKMLLVTALALLALALLTAPASAECPSGCSGNGDCMAKDMCNCYKNYQGNDCSQRTCQFGYAHVDTPKGDINMDGDRKTPVGSSWTLLLNSQQHPAGAYEYFYPDASASEAHFYMECSNKGLCDRSMGTCTCFDGFEGVACQRAACPNKCSGHGTCESIRELGHKAAGTLFGVEHPSGPMVYDLWDANSTYGCRCDPWYEGADCSIRSCKVGVDPLFLAVGTATYETFVIHAFIDDTLSATLTFPTVSNTLRLRLFDYYGESYITDEIPILNGADATNGAANKVKNAAAVQKAIKKLPNQTFRDVLCEPVASTETDAYLDKYLSVAPATSLVGGLHVICQFSDNPGKMRIPEVASVNFEGMTVADSKAVVVTTGQQGFNDEWFTVDTGIILGTSTSNLGVTWTLGTGSVDPTTLMSTVNLQLIKVGANILLGTVSATGIVLEYPLLDDSVKSVFMPFTETKAAAAGTSFGVKLIDDTSAAVVLNAAANVGEDWLVFTTKPDGLATGDLIFFENQFFTIQESTVETGPLYKVRLDKPFGGTAAAGAAAATSTKFYKITMPEDTTKIYNYVSPCSGRGLCPADTGVCACFKGYTNDNCNTQNILAL